MWQKQEGGTKSPDLDWQLSHQRPAILSRGGVSLSGHASDVHVAVECDFDQVM